MLACCFSYTFSILASYKKLEFKEAEKAINI